MGYQWHRVHPFTFDDCIGLFYELDRLLSWELPICFMYSQRISREKLYQKFSDNVINIQPIFLRVWGEKKDTDAMDLQRQYLNHKPSSNSQSMEGW